MKKLPNIIIFILLASNFSLAESEISAIDRYKSDTTVQLTMCSMMFKLAQLNIQNGTPLTSNSNYPSCIKNSKAELKTSLDKALQTIKKTEAKNALKNYHIAVMTALEGINPGENEIKISYAQRQIQLKEKATLAWERFEIEQ